MSTNREQHGRRIAERYELDHLLGRGGGGAVWRATDRRLQRDVAVKEVQFPASLAPDERSVLRARVQREARAAGRLSHPSVISVYDVVEEDGHAYIVMELVDAPDLTAVVRQEGTVSPARAAAIGRAVLDALTAAHAAGIVHRDVKPSNVLVAGDTVKLGDFGVASLTGDATITTTGVAVGSPAYMAPEQARDAEASPASDLWGLGALLHFAVEGAPPFDRGQALATLHAVLHDDPQPAANAGALAPLIAALLTKDPAARPDAQTVRAQLDDVLAAPAPVATKPQTSATPPPAAPSASGGRSRPRAALALVALLALIVLGGVAALALAPGDETGGDGGAETAQAPAEDADNSEEADEPDEPDEPADAQDPAEEAEPAEEQADDAEQGISVAPDDWSVHTDDATGYRIAHPPDWEVVSQSGTLTDFRDPDSPTYLRVDWTDDPPADPVADWRQQSASFGERHEGYEELRIEPVTYRGYDAALWEYRYEADGTSLRAANLGVDTGAYGHALNFQTTEAAWEDSQDLYETFQQVFEPGG